MDKAKKNSLNRTVSTRTIILPAVVLIIIIMAAVTVFVHITNSLNRKLAQSLRNSAEDVEEISDFMQGVGMLNETSASFIVNPIDGNGEIIWGQIMPFAVELGTGERRADDLLAFFDSRDIDEETLEYINSACEDSRFFLDTQLHAIALITSVHPLPSMPALEPIAHLEITEEEANMSAQERLGLAKSLILNENYGAHRKSLAAAVNAAVNNVKDSSSKQIEKTNHMVNVMRALLWVSVSLTILILAGAFIAIYRFLVSPLTEASKRFLHNKKLNERYGLKELRIAATSYNSLLERRNDFEKLLKNAAETDALTNLPNRYAFENCIKSLESGGDIYPICYYSFDINYLKHTNDTYGHVSGDKLLADAARIIKECFGDNCFRIGGDEFAAVIKNYSAEKSVDVEKIFVSLTEKEGISISFGSSVTNDLDVKSIDQLMVEADIMMYGRKRILHANSKEKVEYTDKVTFS